MKDLIINRRIRASFVRVIGAEGEQLGILDTREAIRVAEGQGLDLVLVAEGSDPPVCKIIDAGKLKYQEKKKAQAAKKKQVSIEVKEVQFRPKTDLHDLEHKSKRTLEFLGEGNKVKVVVVYRGREMEHLGIGWETLKRFVAKLNDQAMFDSRPKMEGKRLGFMLGPVPTGKKPVPGSLLASLEIPHEVMRSIKKNESMREAPSNPPTQNGEANKGAS